MDQIRHFERLFAYDGWANREVLARLRDVPAPLPRAIALLAHVLASQRLWMERLEQKPQSLPVWPDFSMEECETQTAELSASWNTYLAGKSEADLARPVSYQNTQGETWSSRKGDILTHLITHSVYHRGQIATTVRAAGFKPAYTDFIHSIRQGFVE